MVALNAVVILSALSAAFLMVAHGDNQDHRAREHRTRAMYIAEAGLSQSLVNLRSGGSAAIGTEEAPLAFGNGTYYVTSESDPLRVRLVAVAEYQGELVAIEGFVSLDTATSAWTGAAFGDISVNLTGDNIIDSYDATAGSYASQSTNGIDGIPVAGSSGHIASDGAITIQGGVVAGDVSANPLTRFGGSVTGATTPPSTDQALPPITIPDTSLLTSFPLLLSGSAAVTRPPGTYLVSQFEVGDDAILTLMGPSTYICSTVSVQSQGTVIVDSTNGPVYFYVTDSFEIQSAGAIYSNRNQPADVLVFLAADNHTGYESDEKGDSNTPLGMQGDSILEGLIYAPDGVVQVEDNASIRGAVKAKRIFMSGNASIHYDITLGQLPWLPQGSGLADLWTNIITGGLLGSDDPTSGGNGESSPPASRSASLICWRLLGSEAALSGGQ